ncbi:hypothetical protein LIER_39554 [Lithospermum erythrorhizon]|uniref:GAG-pre-integrase domain-containing protein n=1 Tax=Lithospermum erythrorhizon TaxID=34254 RepID=A0AAV3QGL2_LITER
MSSDQWQQVIGMFSKAVSTSHDERLMGKSLNCEWIIDTGAFNHVTGNIRLLSNVSTMPACPIGLPDGKQTTSTQFGIVRLKCGLILNKVFFVPDFDCNLLSVSYLSDDLNCVLQFTNTLLVVQDSTSRTLIGVGEQRGGLYYLHDEPVVRVMVVERLNQLELWHKRLGHPSERVVRSLPFIRSSNLSLNKACGLCHQTKHSRDKFPHSEHKSTYCFQLVHCDLWGPYNTHASCGARYFLTLVDNFSNAVWAFLLVDKLEVARMFKWDKFSSRSRKCVFLGYPLGKKGWKLYDLDRCEFFVSRDVQFYEEEFSFPIPLSTVLPTTIVSSSTMHDLEEDSLAINDGLVVSGDSLGSGVADCPAVATQLPPERDSQPPAETTVVEGLHQGTAETPQSPRLAGGASVSTGEAIGV